MLLQTCKTFFIFGTQMKIFLKKSESFFPTFFNYHFDALKSSYRDHKTNPFDLSSLVQILWREYQT